MDRLITRAVQIEGYLSAYEERFKLLAGVANLAAASGKAQNNRIKTLESEVAKWKQVSEDAAVAKTKVEACDIVEAALAGEDVKCPEFQHLLNKLNRVTSNYLHGRHIAEKDLTNLANAQVKYEQRKPK